MKRLMIPVIASVLLGCLSGGCAGYCPVRWPRRDLWSAGPNPTPPIELPRQTLRAASHGVEHEQVTLAIELMDRAQTNASFHADLLRDRIQPLRLLIRNDSEQSYLFSQRQVGVRVLPAADAARFAMIHPARQAARNIRWLAFLVPGFLVESIVEPASTFDLPGIEEAAQRPPRPDRRRILADFLQHEMADAPIAPHSTRAGVLFIRPVKLGSTIPITLQDVRTRQPLVFDVPTPPPVYVEAHDYFVPYEPVWNAAVTAATGMTSWRVRSMDPSRGLLTLRTGLNLLPWTARRRITVTVRQIAARRTQVAVECSLRRTDSAGLGDRAPAIETFVAQLDQSLPQALPRRKRLRRHPPAASSAEAQEGGSALSPSVVQ